MENWYDDPKIMDEASQEWFDKPQIVAELQNVFDPEGSGYDMKSAKKSGMKPVIDPEDGLPHYGSVIEATKQQKSKYGLPDESYMLLKGKEHETWDKAIQAEADRGFRVKKFGDRYFSIPAEIDSKGKGEVEMFADYIAGYEGFEDKAYLLKGEKNYTIGYGHNSPDVKEGQTITKEEARELLLKDVQSRVPELQNAFKDFNKFSLDLKQNLMSSWFRGSLVGSPNTRKLINAGKFKEAADEFLNHD